MMFDRSGSEDVGFGHGRLARKRLLMRVLLASAVLVVAAIGGVWLYAGSYGVRVLLWHGGTYWFAVDPNDPRLSPAVRLALNGPPPVAPGRLEWRTIGLGFEVGELPVMAGDLEVDRIFLAWIDPARFRFEVRTAPSRRLDLDGWMTRLGAALVINGSYYSQHGAPDTPIISAGISMGPKTYDAKAGAFVAAADFVGVRDLGPQSWQAAFAGAHDAMVSYPLLVSERGPSRVASSAWLATRSFVGHDTDGRIILGTTADGFFSLDRLSAFLRQAPLALRLALNLDGGPVACQGISLNGFERRTYGKWELQAKGADVKLLTWPYGTAEMPVALAVFPK
jgi:hypothetical protein